MEPDKIEEKVIPFIVQGYYRTRAGAWYLFEGIIAEEKARVSHGTEHFWIPINGKYDSSTSQPHDKDIVECLGPVVDKMHCELKPVFAVQAHGRYLLRDGSTARFFGDNIGEYVYVHTDQGPVVVHKSGRKNPIYLTAHDVVGYVRR